jgi:hypothetical protein
MRSFNGSDKIRSKENEIIYYRSDGCQLHGQRIEYEGKHNKSPVEPCHVFNLNRHEKEKQYFKIRGTDRQRPKKRQIQMLWAD